MKVLSKYNYGLPVTIGLLPIVMILTDSFVSIGLFFILLISLDIFHFVRSGSLSLSKFIHKSVMFFDLCFYLFAVTFICSTLYLYFNLDMISMSKSIEIGVIAGIPGLIVGHSLIHSRNHLSQFLGKLIFSLVGYPQFSFIHVHIHHKYLNKEEDFSTADEEDSIYTFILKNIGKELKLINIILKKCSKIQLIIPFALITLLSLKFGAKGFLFFLIVTLTARVIIEVVNYAQHFSLSNDDSHSWDLSHFSLNTLLFNAGLHTEHHIRPGIHSAKLTHFEKRRSYSIIFPIVMISIFIPAAFRKLIMWEKSREIFNTPLVS